MTDTQVWFIAGMGEGWLYSPTKTPDRRQQVGYTAR